MCSPLLVLSFYQTLLVGNGRYVVCIAGKKIVPLTLCDVITRGGFEVKMAENERDVGEEEAKLRLTIKTTKKKETVEITGESTVKQVR